MLRDWRNWLWAETAWFSPTCIRYASFHIVRPWPNNGLRIHSCTARDQMTSRPVSVAASCASCVASTSSNEGPIEGSSSRATATRTPNVNSEKAARPHAWARSTSSKGTAIAAAAQVVLDCAITNTATPMTIPRRCSQRRSKGWWIASSKYTKATGPMLLAWLSSPQNRTVTPGIKLW